MKTEIFEFLAQSELVDSKDEKAINDALDSQKCNDHIEEGLTHNCWWHSHVMFSPFWSGTDEAQMNRFFSTMVRDPMYLVSVVANKHGEYRARLQLQSDGIYASWDDLQIEIVDDSKMDWEQQKFEDLDITNLALVKRFLQKNYAPHNPSYLGAHPGHSSEQTFLSSHTARERMFWQAMEKELNENLINKKWDGHLYSGADLSLFQEVMRKW